MAHSEVITTSPGTTDEPLTRAVLLSAIDKEIELRLSLEKRNGWSSWLLAGAACTVAWTFAKGLDLSKTDWRLLGTLTLLCSIVYDVLVLVWFAIQPWSNSKQRVARFLAPRFYAASVVPSVIAYLIRACLLIAFASAVLWRSSPIVGPAVLHYAIVIIAQAFLLLLFMLRIPLGEPKHRGPVHAIARFGLLLLVASPALAALLAGWNQIRASQTELLEYHIQQSILCAGLLVMLPKLARVLPPPALPERLLELRRNLAFGQMPVQEATRHAEYVLLGMSTRDVLEEDCADAHILIAELRVCAIKMNDTLQAIINMAPQQPPPPGAQRLAFDALFLSLDQLQDKCDETSARLESEVKSLGKRLKLLQAMRIDQEALEAQLSALKSSHAEVRKSISSISEALKNWPARKHISALKGSDMSRKV